MGHDPRALAEIHRLAHLDRIAYSNRALLRMVERGAELEDVRAALISSTSAIARTAGPGESPVAATTKAMS